MRQNASGSGESLKKPVSGRHPSITMLPPRTRTKKTMRSALSISASLHECYPFNLQSEVKSCCEVALAVLVRAREASATTLFQPGAFERARVAGLGCEAVNSRGRQAGRHARLSGYGLCGGPPEVLPRSFRCIVAPHTLRIRQFLHSPSRVPSATSKAIHLAKPSSCVPHPSATFLRTAGLYSISVHHLET